MSELFSLVRKFRSPFKFYTPKSNINEDNNNQNTKYAINNNKKIVDEVRAKFIYVSRKSMVLVDTLNKKKITIEEHFGSSHTRIIFLLPTNSQ